MKKNHRWTKEDIKELDTLILTKTNPEIAKHFNISIKSAETAIKRYTKRRDKKLVSKLLSDSGKRSCLLHPRIGENNPHWKGGVSKDNYRYKKVQIKRYPEKIKARVIVHNAIKSGRLKRGGCEICNKSNAHAHHEDYSKPLEIHWLCREHHKEYHEGLLQIDPNKLIVITSDIKYREIKSDGNVKSDRRVKLEGKRFHKLKVLEYTGKTKQRVSLYQVICDCGNERIVESGALTSGRSKTCGCCRK